MRDHRKGLSTYVSSALSDHLPCIYKPGPSRRTPWVRLALHVPGIPGAGVLRRHHFHDHRGRHHHLQPPERPADPAPGARKGDSYQCGHDSGRPVRLLLQPLLHPSVPVGHSLRPGCGQRGRRPQQLCSSPLLQHTHELAPLHVGCGSLRRPLHHGPCTLRRRPLEHRLPVCRHPAGHPHGHPAPQPSSVEEPADRNGQ